MYEQDLGEIEPGAYSVRVTQTRPGAAALGRTLGLVAPTAAEYRILGANEPFLAALRAATGGEAIEDVAQVWTHNLTSTSRFTDLWPLLLVVALLLWPLDIALRRVSIGRRELVAARGWVTGRRTPAEDASRHGRRSPEGLLAARDRASSTSARSALRAEPDSGASAASRPRPRAASPTPAAPPPAPKPAADAATPPRGAGTARRHRHDVPAAGRQAARTRALTPGPDALPARQGRPC